MSPRPALAAIIAILLPGCVQFTAQLRRDDQTILRVQLTQFMTKTTRQTYGGPAGSYSVESSDQTKAVQGITKTVASGAVSSLR